MELKRSKKFLLKLLLVVVVLAIAAAPAYYYYTKYQKAQRLLKNPTEAAKQETQALVQKVGTLIQLPASEDPTIATVTDKEKIKDQPFFASAQNEDKVLIYTQAKKAILYRPSSNKIIEVSTVNIGADTSTTTKK